MDASSAAASGPLSSQEWAGAADIAHALGTSALGLNKVLEDEGLWDAARHAPTERALSEGWVQVEPPDSTEGDAPSPVLWSVRRIAAMLEREGEPPSKAEIAFEGFVREILRREAEGRTAGDEGSAARAYIVEELPRYRGVEAEVVASVCRRLGIEERTDEFVTLVAPAETGRSPATLTGEPEEADDPPGDPGEGGPR